MHQLNIKIRGYHLDLYGHVNNARYLEFLEEARWAAFESTGQLSQFLNSHLAFVIVNINIDYRHPATMGDEITLHTYVESISNRSSVVRQKAYLKNSEVLVIDAAVTFVLFDAQQNKAVIIEDSSRALLAQLMLKTE